MSGGYFEYQQYHINEIAESIRRIIDKNGKKISRKKLKEWHFLNDEEIDELSSDDYRLYEYNYPDEVIKEMKKGYTILKKASVYAQRIDWLVSGDDGEESFIAKLKEDLNKL